MGFIVGNAQVWFYFFNFSRNFTIKSKQLPFNITFSVRFRDFSKKKNQEIVN